MGDARQTIDWVAVIEQLRQRDPPLSFSEIAHGAELSKSTVVEMSQGCIKPLHATGERLIAYWCRVTNLRREQLPTTTFR